MIPCTVYPTQTEKTFLGEIEEYLWLSKMLLVLHQADRDPSMVIHVLLEHMQPRFPEGHSWLIIPPTGEDADADHFFQTLARQLGITQKVHSRTDFEQQFLDLLTDKQGQAFLLIMGFEDICEHCRYDLASLLHVATAIHSAFRVVISGGERLYHLSHADGESSLLNSATVCELPGFSSAELQERAGMQALSLPPPISDRILEVTGGHGLLATHLIKQWGQDQNTAFRERLLHDPYLLPNLWSCCGLSSPADRERLANLLKTDDLGDITMAWVKDSLLQRLYWQGLVKEKEYTLRWRSACIQEAGQQWLATAAKIKFP